MLVSNIVTRSKRSCVRTATSKRHRSRYLQLFIHLFYKLKHFEDPVFSSLRFTKYIKNKIILFYEIIIAGYFNEKVL